MCCVYEFVYNFLRYVFAKNWENWITSDYHKYKKGDVFSETQCSFKLVFLSQRMLALLNFTSGLDPDLEFIFTCLALYVCNRINYS